MSSKGLFLYLSLSLLLVGCSNLLYVTGYIYDSEGNPVSGALVRFYTPRPSERKSYAGTSDPQGRYDLTYVTSGVRYDEGFLMVYKEGYKMAVIPHTARNKKSDHNITLEPSQ